jgi:hypothetical protein
MALLTTERGRQSGDLSMASSGSCCPAHNAGGQGGEGMGETRFGKPLRRAKGRGSMQRGGSTRRAYPNPAMALRREGILAHAGSFSSSSFSTVSEEAAESIVPSCFHYLIISNREGSCEGVQSGLVIPVA